MINAAALILTHNGKWLFVKRGPDGDHPGEWCFPGGKVEPGETFKEAALREGREEIGPYEVSDLGQIAKTFYPPDGVECAFFKGKTARKFKPVLNDELVDYVWASPATPPMSLHPGAEIAVNLPRMDEMQVAEAIASGALASPVYFKNMLLVAIRITGVGSAYRGAIIDENGDIERPEEFVWRDEDFYLTDAFIKRCNGLPVISGHPDDAEALNSAEFANRSVGSIMLPYKRGDEVWGIARVYNEKTINDILSGEFSTSPNVVFDKTRIQIDENGDRLHIEGAPTFLDHIAIVSAGVWDKEGPPSGIDISAFNEGVKMSEEKNVTEMNKIDDRLNKLEQSTASALSSIAQAVAEMSEIMKTDRNDRSDRKERKDAESHEEGEEVSRREPRDKRGEFEDKWHETEMKREPRARDGEFDSRRDRKDHEDEDDKETAMVDRRDRKDGNRHDRRDSRKDDREDDREDEEDGRRKRADRKDCDDLVSAKDRRDRKDSERRDEYRSRRDRNDHEKRDDHRARKDNDEPFMKWAAQEMQEPAHGGDNDAEMKATQKKIADLEEKIAFLTRETAPEEIDIIADTQRRADSVAAMHGDRAIAPMPGENSLNYRRRQLEKFKKFSPKFKTTSLTGLDKEIIGAIEDHIYSDAAEAAKREWKNSGIGMIHMETVTDASGRKITRGHGDPLGWMAQFSHPPAVVTLGIK